MMARMCDPTLSVRLGVSWEVLGHGWVYSWLVAWLWNFFAWESAKKGV